MSDELQALRQQNKRLRAALYDIAAIRFSVHTFLEATYMRRIARDVLHAEPEISQEDRCEKKCTR